jgi:sugar phosphate isomerase/epimerase
MKWTLGCTTRPYARLDFASACAHIAAAGYSDVALFGDAGVSSESDQETVLAARQTARDTGLCPSMLLVRAQFELGHEAAVADYRRLIDNAALLGASWLLDLGASSPHGRQSAAQRSAYIDLMKQVTPYAQQAGLSISLKPHGGITLATPDLVSIYQEIDHPAFGICYDPGNIVYYSRGEERPEMHIADVASLVTTLIVKDCSLDDGKPDVMVTPGEGLVDFPAVLSALIHGGFHGPLYVECVGGETVGDIDTNVRRTLSFVQGLLP